MKRFAVYGKGGIGKSTIVSNMAAVWGAQGKRVLIIGCDPKADSTRNLVQKRLPSVLDVFRAKGKDNLRLEDILFQGEQGVYCLESGGPEPGVGCAGRGISTTMDILNHLDLFNRLAPDLVLFDVLGDVVCGGFAMPLQKQWVEQVFIVTTSDAMALYAANNICKGMLLYTLRRQVALGGLIYNGRSVTDQRETVERFAQKVGTRIIGHIPMSEVIGQAEIERQTVITYAPESQPAQRFRELAHTVFLTEETTYNIHPLAEDAFDELVKEGAAIRKAMPTPS